MANKSKILVLLLRHGEREDEAIRSSSHHSRKKKVSDLVDLSHSRRLDPYMTARGHDQARIALVNLIRALSESAMTDDDSTQPRKPKLPSFLPHYGVQSAQH
jgi:hypothetical protein